MNIYDEEYAQVQFEKIFRNHLKVESFSKSIESLFSVRARSKLDYKPYYQRNYVWDLRKATYFIESIILGTEIPPLIFFSADNDIEVIDGRQRYETILKFQQDEFKLSGGGLSQFKSLKGKTFSTLPENVRDIFLDATLRIIEFRVVNEPILDPLLQDKVKKEIFGRYNTGITPLKKFEIDNAVFDSDELTNYLKSKLRKDEDMLEELGALFFNLRGQPDRNKILSEVLSFVRDIITKYKIPLSYYSEAAKRDLSRHFYEQLADSLPNTELIFKDLSEKVKLTSELKSKLQNRDVVDNKLMYECYLWGLYVLTNEDKWNEGAILKYTTLFEEQCIDKPELYTMNDHGFRNQVLQRYRATLSVIEKSLNKNLGIYDQRNNELRREIKKEDGIDDRLDELESLRINKPDPTRTPIESILGILKRRKFLLRPSYQRQESINITKASGIIESVLLGINLPAIFVFKRNDGISEVIDGQQRLLTFLGFICEGFIDENGDFQEPKLKNFKLKGMKVLKELEGCSFSELPPAMQDKVWDFEMFVVNIDSKINPSFDPIDLFIRLNDKPYPIREHSFEMWNSWIHPEITSSVKNYVKDIKEWFYVKKPAGKNYRDRMENEELLTSLAYLDYKKESVDDLKSLGVFQKETRINARIKTKKDISNLLNKLVTNEEIKLEFERSIKNVKAFIKNLKLILVSENIEKDKEAIYLRGQLDLLLSSSGKRSNQEFYILWLCLSGLTYTLVKDHRRKLREKVILVILFFKDISEVAHKEGMAVEKLFEMISELRSQLVSNERKLKLSEEQKQQLLEEQDFKCAISGKDLFISDDVHADHITPLTRGGDDVIANIQLVHSDENLKKYNN